MIELYDFSQYELSSRNLQYAGRAGEKRGILINGEFWFLKFPKNTIGMNNVNQMSYVTSPLSEFIGSNIFKILGYDVHDTRLGICFDGKRFKVVCACRDFIVDDKNELLIPYTALRNDSNPDLMAKSDGSFKSASNINEIIFQLKHNTVLKNIPNIVERFWETAIIDILINNNDRNEDNWGVIKNKKESMYKLAPIYDCGNSFYSKASEARIITLLKDKNKLISSSINGVTAYEDDEANRLTAAQFLQLQNEDLEIAKNKVTKMIKTHLNEIECLINSIPNSFNGVEIITDNRKKYYFETIKERLRMLESA